MGYGKILDSKKEFDQVVSSFGLEATPFDDQGLVLKRADQTQKIQRCTYCCLCTRAPLKPCLCGTAQYCSADCQKNDSKLHIHAHRDMLERDGRGAYDFKHEEDV